MNRIDVSNWKEFELIDLFDFSLPKGDIQIKGLDVGDIALITPSNSNNGLIQRIPLESESTLYNAGCLTVDMFGNSYYHEEDFFVTAHGHVNVLIPKVKISKNVGLFVATSIKAMFLQKYGFNDMCTQKVLKVEKIKLPADDNDNPNWTYMESYIENLESTVSDSLMKLNNAKNTSKSGIDVSGWQDFHLYDKELFSIDSGTKLDRIKMDMDSEEISFVGRSNVNNGITAKVKKIEGLEPYKKGNLTLALGGAYLGSCFVQPDDFYTSQNVVVLIPNHDMSFNVKQFIASAIFVESQNNYQAFIKELNAHIKRNFTIKLPVILDGVPDRDYMEQYMERLQKKTEQIIACFSRKNIVI